MIVLLFGKNAKTPAQVFKRAFVGENLFIAID